MNTRSLLLALVPALACAQTDLNVLPPPDPKQPMAQLQTWLEQQCFAALDRRTAAYEKVKSPEQIAAWQTERREFFVRQLGGFPERTPLNAQTVATLDRGDYTIEKVIFESEPKHHVTALLYLPRTKAPYPGVIVPCGHSANGKAAEAYQRACILLARSGIAALCYDPIGQGERAQILKPDGKAAFNSTQEHTLVGVGSILLGTNTARHRIWDGMRALDYLASRPEVDAKRLGCTGNSGGGTLTCYLMALDDRIAVAAPSCYPTTFRELLKAGPQDAEQNIFGQIAFGMDIADYTLMRAPKPTLINAATLDTTFTIAGAWDLFREAKRFYTRMGYANRVELTEADAPHGFTTHLRVGSARWMSRWLLKSDAEVVEDEKTPILTDPEALCSPKGQVMLMPGERSTFDINADIETRLAAQRRDLWANKADALAKVRGVAGVRRLAELPDPRQRSVGVIQRETCRVEKLVIEPEPGIELPALRFTPPRPGGEPVLFLHETGKAADLPAIEQLIAKGHVVLAVDLRGMGETQNRGRKWYGSTFGPAAGEFFLAYLLGKSLTGLWTEDVLTCARLLGADGTRVRIVAIGNAGVAALHAAALEPEMFTALTLRRTLGSWAEVVRTPSAPAQLATAIHGALGIYDLPDLVASLGAKVIIEEPAKP
ncbi:MAG: acetylxylan esterase [Chthoniobacteraceae bacterium]